MWLKSLGKSFPSTAGTIPGLCMSTVHTPVGVSRPFAEMTFRPSLVSRQRERGRGNALKAWIFFICSPTHLHVFLLFFKGRREKWSSVSARFYVLKTLRPPNFTFSPLKKDKTMFLSITSVCFTSWLKKIMWLLLIIWPMIYYRQVIVVKWLHVYPPTADRNSQGWWLSS